MDEKELLFTEILGCDRAGLYLHRGRTLGRRDGVKIAAVLRRRMRGEPLAYILGTTEFMGLEFIVSPDVLVPRPDTEILVEAVLDRVNKLTGEHVNKPARDQANKPRILEIGTGSGCIAVSLAKSLPGARIVATDISGEALRIARANAGKNGVDTQIDFIQCDMFPPVRGAAGRFDLIVSNPPYVRSADIDGLEPEVRAEPRVALDGGADGLEIVRRMLRDAGRHLAAGGSLLVEIGYDQKEQVRELCARSKKYAVREWVKDYSGIDRVAVIGSLEGCHG